MFEKVKDIISNFTEVEDITPESSLMGDLELTSFDLVALVAEFEAEFDIEVEDREIMDFVTVGDIVKFLEEKVG